MLKSCQSVPKLKYARPSIVVLPPSVDRSKCKILSIDVSLVLLKHYCQNPIVANAVRWGGSMALWVKPKTTSRATKLPIVALHPKACQLL